MLSFDYRLMFRLLCKAVFESSGTNARLTPKRAGMLLFFCISFLFIEVPALIGFLLDEIFFSDYRSTPVSEPVFIVGVPRSGTTLLQRLLARDAGQFTSMKLWEILFAPSITQKKFWKFVGRLDGYVGSPMYRLITAWEKRQFDKMHRMHKTSLFEPEEDDIILMHIFSTSFYFFMFPFKEEIRKFAQFDTDLPHKDRVRIMSFYKRCVQCHLYVYGREKKFLSKNPAFSPKIHAVYETFPDARIIYMLRNPLEAIPSCISLLSFLYSAFSSPLEPYPMRDTTLEVVSIWYRYPLEQFKKIPAQHYLIVKYDSMVKDLKKTVINIYRHFNFPLTNAFLAILDQETEKARQYKSRHAYSLEQFGLTQKQIVNDFRYLFDEFGFDTQQEKSPVNAAQR